MTHYFTAAEETFEISTEEVRTAIKGARRQIEAQGGLATILPG